jgi:nucleotide-binding universal stress UspA family protein
MAGIVVGVDESMGAAQALRWGLREAQLHGWPVSATMAWGLLDQHHRVVEEPAFDPDYAEPDAAAALDAYVDAVVGREGSVAVERRVVCGPTAWALIDAARDADLLVVGARGLRGFEGLLMGSVSQHCLLHAPCAITIVRERPSPPAGRRERIVVGVDGSAHAQRALAWAVEEARVRAAELDVVYAWHYPVFGSLPYPATVMPDPSDFDRAGHEVLETALARTGVDGRSFPVERIVAWGMAAGTILDVAKGADLVVVGARGLGGFRGLLLGSVSHQVALHAECPVMVVPVVH